MGHHLVGVREIAAMLMVRRQRADQLTRIKGFPDPVVDLASGRVWATEDVLRWAAEQRPISDIVKEELGLLPKGSRADALSVYRMAYAVVRQKALGVHPEGMPPTREFAHEQAMAAARKVDPHFELKLHQTG